MATMLDVLTIEADEESFVIVLQHGHIEVTWKRSIDITWYIEYSHFHGSEFGFKPTMVNFKAALWNVSIAIFQGIL